MKEINLRDYYPHYTTDKYVEVPDEVFAILEEFRLSEAAYRLRTYRYKAFYSLDYGDDIEREAIYQYPSPLEILEHQRMIALLYQGLDVLSEKQRRRIYAHYFLGMSQKAIADIECCDKSSVRDSINRGLRQLKKFFEKV